MGEGEGERRGDCEGAGEEPERGQTAAPLDRAPAEASPAVPAAAAAGAPADPTPDRLAVPSAALKRWGGRLLLALLVPLALLALFVRWRYGGGRSDFPQRIGRPLLSGSALEEVAALPLPPGNVAVSDDGRVFLSLHPEGRPAVKVVELLGRRLHPFPGPQWQAPRGRGADGVPRPFFDTVLGVRIDRQGRLWTLDNGNHGLGQPRLLAFDLERGTLVARFDFAPRQAPRGSHLNDLQVTPDGRHVVIADASIFRRDPALLVVDTVRGTVRRLLAGHPAVAAERYVPVVGGRRMSVFGLFAIRPGVDSIALDRRGEHLYFAAVTARRLYRVPLAALLDPTLPVGELARQVQPFADKPMSDGLSTDLAGNLLLTDFPHDALQLLSPAGRLTTLVRDPRLRWPDGLSYGPCGRWQGAARGPGAPVDCLYVTCSALHRVIGRTPWQVRRAGPFQVFRLRPPHPGLAGH